jgi:hypothetical protein
MRSAWCVGVTATSLLLMASTALAQSFCSDLDLPVKLAPSGFRSLLEDANSGPIERGVTRTLPGASRCWYENGAEAYWCAWDVPPAQVEIRVKQLADAIGQCYHVKAEYETTPAGDGVVAFVDLPNAISVYINGVGGMVALSIGGRSTEGAGDHRPVGPPRRLAPTTLQRRPFSLRFPLGHPCRRSAPTLQRPGGKRAGSEPLGTALQLGPFAEDTEGMCQCPPGRVRTT